MSRGKIMTLALTAAVTLFTLHQCGKIGIDRRDEHGMTALMRAARAGDQPEVERLLRRGANVNARVPSRGLRELIAFLSWMQQLPESDIGYTPLHYAVQARHLDIAKLFLDRGAEHSASHRMAFPPLNIAVHHSDVAIIGLLLAAGARPDAQQLSLAVTSSSPQTVEALLAGGADPNAVRIKRAGTSGAPWPPPIILAARRGDTNVLKLLLAAGANPGLRDHNGWTAMRAAADRAARLPNSARIVELLGGAGGSDSSGLRAKALFDAVFAKDLGRVRAALRDRGNPNARDDLGVPPLIYAAGYGNADIVTALVEAGANVNARPEHQTTPLNAAIESGSIEVVKILLAAGAKPNRADALHQTPLQIAASRKRTEIAALLIKLTPVDPGALPLAALSGDAEQVRLLLSSGVDPNANEGHALREAARGCMRRDNIDVIRALLDGGANPRLPGSRGIHTASALCTAEVVRLMLDRGADPNWREPLNQSTPLISAAASGNLETVKVLIVAGADVNARDDYGKTALAYAANHPEVQQELRRKTDQD